MSARALRLAPGVCALLVVGMLAQGCYTPGYNTYATPRTTPRGKIAGAVHVQGVGFSGELSGKHETYAALFLPGFSGRVGIADRFDAGARLGVLFEPVGEGNTVSLAGDAKWLALPGERVDLALNPGFGMTNFDRLAVDANGYLYRESHRRWLLDVPVVMGLNLSSHAIVVLSAGLTYAWRTPDVEPANHAERGRSPVGAAPRVGLGLDLRMNKRFGIHPEVNLVFSRAENERRMIYTGGLAFKFGALPQAFRED